MRPLAQAVPSAKAKVPRDEPGGKPWVETHNAALPATPIFLEHRSAMSSGEPTKRGSSRHGLAISREFPPFLQRKAVAGHERLKPDVGIRIGAPDDVFEREADAVAERVVSGGVGRGPLMSVESRVQRKCAACEDEEDHLLQAKHASTSAPKPGGESMAPSSVDAALRGTGRVLDPGVRAFLEPRFGRDLSGVRVHADEAAARSARHINALAYTAGRDIVFGTGEYSPGTNRGMRLLAHELAHVVQQGDGSASRPELLQRKPKDAAENAATPASPIGGCTETQSGSLRKLLSLARALVGVAIAHLKKERDQPPAPGIGSVARRALTHNFHTSDPKDLAAILSNFQRILEKLKDSNVRCLDDKACDDVCAGDGAPFACASAAIPITVCAGIFESTHRKEPFFYVVVLIHEAAHQAGMGGHTYEPPKDGKLTSRELALRSADSYANFAEDCSVNGTGFYNFFRRK